jgi:hypothetical protein
MKEMTFDTVVRSELRRGDVLLVNSLPRLCLDIGHFEGEAVAFLIPFDKRGQDVDVFKLRRALYGRLRTPKLLAWHRAMMGPN